MTPDQIEQLKELATDSTDFYLSCKSAAAALALPYPGQYADYINSAIARGEITGDVERVALAVLNDCTIPGDAVEAARTALDALPARSDIEVIMRIIDPAGLLSDLPMGQLR